MRSPTRRENGRASTLFTHGAKRLARRETAAAWPSTNSAGLGRLRFAILVLASLWLVIDAGEIQSIVANNSPKYMEWYGAFTLMVTLCWIYYEALKLAFRLAIMFSSRD